MKDIAIIGAGGFGREVKMLIDQINAVVPTYRLIGFFDDKFYDKPINGLPYLGSVSDINNTENELAIALAIADPATKKKVLEKIISKLVSFPNLVHPTVIIGTDSVNLGRGNIICAATILTVNISLHNFIILNLACTVGHDTIIKDYCSFMPSVNISGEVTIEQGVYAGTGAKIINLLEIGENTIIGAGAVVSKSLPANCTAVGIPAKPIKFH